MGAAGAGVLAVATVVQAPYAIAYVDPLVGQERAEDLILLGWGEGIERLGAEIDRREAGRCDEVDVLLLNAQRVMAVPCGRLDVAGPADSGRYEYAIRYISNRQRGTFEDRFEPIVQDGTLIDRVRIGGVTYAELWALP